MTKFKYLKYTVGGVTSSWYANLSAVGEKTPSQRHLRMEIAPFTKEAYKYHGVINDAPRKNQNKIRRWLRILRNHGITRDLRLMMSEDGKDIRLLVYNANHAGYPSYLAGIIKGEERLRWRKKRRKKKLTSTAPSLMPQDSEL